MSKFRVTVEELSKNMLEVLDHPDYQSNANKFLTYYMDQPISTLDEGAFKFNRLLKYGGRMPKHFYPKGLDLTYLQTLNLDLIVLFPVIFMFFTSK